MNVNSKGDSDEGQGDSSGSKTGMGVDGPMNASMMNANAMNAHALLIGVGRCEYPKWSLPVTTLDVQELHRVLVDPNLCGYPKEQIRILSDEEATRDGIIAAMDELARNAEEDPEATFLVYYSGHGWRQSGEDGEHYFLIPHDVRPFDLAPSALSADDFIQGLRSLRGKRVLVMIDTCHASAMADAKNLVMDAIPQGFAQEPLPKALVEALVEELSAGEGRAVFLSCGEAQKSWILPGEGSLSIFTHHLLAALKGAGSAPKDRLVTVSSLMRHLGEGIPESAREIGKEQTPFFKLEAQDFPVALIRGGKGLPILGEEAPVPTEKAAAEGSSIGIGEINARRNVVVAHRIDTVQ